MATDILSQISGLKTQLSGYDTQIGATKSKISGSPTYSTVGASSSDMSNETALKSLQTKRQGIQDELLKAQWYGAPADPNAPTPPVKTSFLEKGLTLLSLPTYLEVGALESLTGKGTKPGFANLIENIKEKETFGDLLTKFGINGTVAAPVGFALDIAGDPVNWLTAGTDALVPRVAEGIIKGGTKGAAEGIGSSLLARGTAAVARNVPYLRDLEGSKSIVGKVAESGIAYNKTIGKDALAEAVARAAKYEQGALLGQKIRSSLAESPKAMEWAKNIPKLPEGVTLDTIENWRTSKPGILMGTKEEKAAAMQAWDAAKPAGTDEVINWKRAKPFGKRLVDTFAPDINWEKRMIEADAKNYADISSGVKVVGAGNIQQRALELSGGVFGKIEYNAKKLEQLGPEGFSKWRAQQIMDEGVLAATDAAPNLKFSNPDDAAHALEAEYLNDQKVNDALQIAANKTDESGAIMEHIDESNYDQVRGRMMATLKSGIQEFNKQKTGITFFDTMANQFSGIKIGNVAVGETIADSYNKLLNGLFKTAKIGGNLIGSMTRAVVGNHTMGLMSGLDGWKPEYQNNVYKSIAFINGWMSTKASSKFISESFYSNPKWVKALSENAGMFQATFGVHPSFFNSTPSQISETIVKLAKDEGRDISGVDMKSLYTTLEDWKKAGLGVDVRMTRAPQAGSVVKTAIESDVNEGLKSTFFVDETMGGGYQKFARSVEEKAAAGSKTYQLLDWYLKRPMEIYSSADGGFKLGYALKMTNTGITEKELSMVSRFYPMIGKGAELDKATNLYKIDPDKALGAVNEIFMNYATMPAAVKVLRTIPFMGAPFGSFMYGMAIKTGKTVRYNPAVFNKINFFLKEFQGDKTPLERQQLQSPYYSWYNKDGMIKLPFFQDNPVYLNVADMIPYYTMNMLQPTERQYDEFVPNTISSIFDKLPIFQQPEGQMLLDYFIMPTILRESNPQGKFGQPLWKQDSNLLQKFGYAGRSLAEAPIPTLAGLLGVPGGIVAPGVTEFIPSFRYRQLSYATQGKSSLGISGKEDPIARTARVLSGTFGLPWYRMNISYTDKNSPNNPTNTQ